VGYVDLTIVDGVVPEYLAAVRENFDTTTAEEFERTCGAMYDRMARSAVRPQWVRYYDFGAGRLPRFLTELVNRISQVPRTRRRFHWRVTAIRRHIRLRRSTNRPVPKATPLSIHLCTADLTIE
jgi:hypothetical protein